MERLGAIATYKDDNDRIIFVKPFNIDTYVDSTGAGDAMGAGIVSRLYHKKDFSFSEFYDALEHSRIWAAHACTILGGAYRCSDRDNFSNFKTRFEAKFKDGWGPIVETKTLAEIEYILRIIDMLN